MLSDIDKKDLIRGLRNEDEHAVDLLVELYGARLFVAANLLCGNTADAQDMMIETLHKAITSIRTFHEDSSLFSWLYGILANLSRMSARKKRRSRVVYVEQLPEIAADCPAMGHRLDKEVLSDYFASAIQKLSQVHQDVVLLRYYGELSIQEIAEALEVTPGTVKSRLFNAIRHLKNLLPKEVNVFCSTGN